jgi:hypothetical protein
VTATTRVRRPQRATSSDPPEGSFVSPFLRHALVLALTAAATYLFAGGLPATEQPATWLVAGAALGVVAALLGRRWLGLLFMVLGAGIGLMLRLNVSLGSGEEALHQLSESAVSYAGALAAAVAGYVVTVAVLEIVLRRRRQVEQAS